MVTDRSPTFKLPAQISTVKISALLTVGIALVAMPAFSQGGMTPGGGAMVPQPRVAPAPQAPVVAPQVPVTVAPNPGVIPTGPAGGPQKTLRVINNSETDTATVDAQYSRTNGNVYGGVDIMVMKQQPGSSSIPTSKTDGTGQTTFRQLEPGTYSVRLPNAGPKGGTVSMTTFVNGTLASRTDFPVGSSVGTFAVGSAKDTITLKFESKAPGTTSTQNPDPQKANVNQSGAVIASE